MAEKKRPKWCRNGMRTLIFKDGTKVLPTRDDYTPLSANPGQQVFDTVSFMRQPMAVRLAWWSEQIEGISDDYSEKSHA